MAYRMDRAWKDTLNELRFEPLRGGSAPIAMASRRSIP